MSAAAFALGVRLDVADVGPLPARRGAAGWPKDLVDGAARSSGRHLDLD